MNGLWRLDGREALVTGGSSGIGKAVAGILLERGAEVTIVGRHQEKLNAVISEWEQAGYSAQALVADVTVEAERRALVEKLDRLDILINNVAGGAEGDFDSYTAEDYAAVFNANVVSAADLSRRCFELLKAGGHGCIVNNASVAGVSYVSTDILYDVTKAAMIHLARHLAVKWASSGVRVNAVAPWLVRTNLTAEVLEDNDFVAYVEDRTPLGRVGEVDEVAATIAFLCLDAAGYLTGQCVTVDGGLTLNSA